MKYLKTTIFLFLSLFLFLPLMSNAHMMDGVESQNITSEEFQEVEGIMIKMMNGENLSETEWQEISEFMTEHSEGDLSLMMPMMMGFNSPWGNYGFHMRGFGSGGFIYWTMILASIVWLLVGILLLAYLLKKLNKEK